MLPSHADYGLGVSASDRLLVERYMQGTLIGCDTMTVNGEHRLLGVHEKLMFAPPSFAIRGSCFTPNGPIFADLERYASEALTAVGFDWGATHMELMITADGPRIIEINPRLVGAKLPRLVGYALGRSIHSDLIDVHLGCWPPELGSDRSDQVAALRWITTSQSGVLDRIELPQWTDPRLRCVELLKRPGDLVHPPFENADRLGFVMTCASSRSEAEELAERYIAQATVALTAEVSCHVGEDATVAHA
jgi:predicted ATP-grasp superfamily ATP-dependent carboligase